MIASDRINASLTKGKINGEMLTPLQKELIKKLKMTGVDMETGVGISTFLETPEMEQEMLDYLIENPQPSEQEILTKLMEILEKSGNSFGKRNNKRSRLGGACFSL